MSDFTRVNVELSRKEFEHRTFTLPHDLAKLYVENKASLDRGPHTDYGCMDHGVYLIWTEDDGTQKSYKINDFDWTTNCTFWKENNELSNEPSGEPFLKSLVKKVKNIT